MQLFTTKAWLELALALILLAGDVAISTPLAKGSALTEQNNLLGRQYGGGLGLQ
jgi:hypothetical protein